VRKRLIRSAAGLAVLGGLAFGGTALATGGGDSATGPAADEARAAALAHLGGGTASSVERDSEDGATWEVEVTRSDGSTVDVRLDASYGVVAVEGDSETGAGSESPGADGADGHPDAPGDPGADIGLEGNE
jgi:hypothetical protein